MRTIPATAGSSRIPRPSQTLAYASIRTSVAVEREHTLCFLEGGLELAGEPGSPAEPAAAVNTARDNVGSFMIRYQSIDSAVPTALLLRQLRNNDTDAMSPAHDLLTQYDLAYPCGQDKSSPRSKTKLGGLRDRLFGKPLAASDRAKLIRLQAEAKENALMAFGAQEAAEKAAKRAEEHASKVQTNLREIREIMANAEDD
ncbi:hypothetical protein M501DRAFT_1016315 [Patellaria atrata CBS 101060]|uniref:Uncharacterized protein n=1 Tax=Patellaria atrata CBS 101060 TaxID=1346257 RepID=A0A9P4SAR7_9PEZI|nr:hypothetical protein M501DRAFT_1016315 [Patellaria atrata CBS 101060]